MTFGLILIPLVILFVFAAMSFWLWMLVDCIKNETDEGNTRLIWGVIIAVTHVIGAGIYLFVRKLGRETREASPAQ